MFAKTQNAAAAVPASAGLALVFIAGLALFAVAGLAQAAVVHDAAHDQRHAMAFPCH